MRLQSLLPILVFAAAAGAGAQNQSKTTGKSSPAKSPVASTKTSAVKKTTPTRPSAPPVRHVAQQQPTPDRYREIQQALADRGYFKGSADGVWGPESAEALKQFQHEQRIDEDGKINSLSLIALGLGPRRNIQMNASARGAASQTPAESGTDASAPR